MKATKKIVGATAALVAAVALSAGSTFAWFATSGEATVSGMQVNVQVPNNMLIAEGFQDDINSLISSTLNLSESFSTATTLKPADLENADGTVTVREPENYTTDPTPSTPGSVTTWTTLGTFSVSVGESDADSHDISEYVLLQPITVARTNDEDSATTYSLNASVTISGIQNNTYTFLKVGFLCGTTFAEAAFANQAEGTVTTSNTVVNATANDNVVQKVYLAIYYDGSDPDCISNNAPSINNLGISITFTAG